MASIETLRKSALTAVLAAAVSFGLGLPAGATLIGDTITITSTANIPVDTWTDNVVVGAGIELLGVENPANAPPYADNGSAFQHTNAILAGATFPDLFSGDFIDVGASSITINYVALGASLGFNYAFQTVFSGLDWTDIPPPGTLTNVVVAAGAVGLVAQNISNITASGFTFQGTVDLVNGANFTLNLTHVHNVLPPPEEEVQVPEPAALPLLATGLLALMVIARRRRAAHPPTRATASAHACRWSSASLCLMG